MTAKSMTDRQLAANRANARLSTGPRTNRGKAASARNALTHGIFSRDLIPPELACYESESEFEELLRRMEAELDPGDGIEAMLVETVAAAAWRLRRVYRTEASFIVARRDAILAEGALGEPEVPAALAAVERCLAAEPPDMVELRSMLAPAGSGREGYSDGALVEVAVATAGSLRAEHEAALARWRGVMRLRASLPATGTAALLGRYATEQQRAIVMTLRELRERREARAKAALAPSFAVIDATWAEEEAEE